jgi:hypothetical protein
MVCAFMQGVMEQYGLCFMMGVMWGESDNFFGSCLERVVN